MDNLDKAMEIEELLRTIALNQPRSKPVAHHATDCEECGDPIGEARKKVMPSARLCLSCQTLLEKRSGI